MLLESNSGAYRDTPIDELGKDDESHGNITILNTVHALSLVMTTMIAPAARIRMGELFRTTLTDKPQNYCLTSGLSAVETPSMDRTPSTVNFACQTTIHPKTSQLLAVTAILRVSFRTTCGCHHVSPYATFQKPALTRSR